MEEAGSSVVGATLGLLAFLLAFTFGLAASRFDSRRVALEDEINTIQTTYLRAELLPEPQRTKVRGLLREYVDMRLEVVSPHVSIGDAIGKSENLKRRMWKHAVEIGAGELGKPDSGISEEMASLFIESLNQMFEANNKRIAEVTRGRVSTSIWIGLFVLAMVALFSMGYDIGITGSPRPLVALGMIVCFAVTVSLIADLDRPRGGLIRVDQQGMIDLRASMNEESP